MNASDLSQSELAERAGVDRSTVSQVLSESSQRVPNAHFIASTGEILGVSTDWLLGLTDRPEKLGDLLATSVTVTKASRTDFDAQIIEWHREAEGYKIRHVPATMPDLLKTPDMQRWEFEQTFAKTPDQAVRAGRDLGEFMAQSGSDFEICLPLHEVQSCARGEGYYRGLDASVRRGQIERILEVHEALFPRVRIMLYDTRLTYSAPLTLFGPLIGVLYVGRYFMAFREAERIRRLSEHFDDLVRNVSVDSRDLPKALEGWLEK